MSNDALSFVRLVERQPWMQSAACKGMDPDLFFGDGRERDGYRDAISVCSGCPVIAECGMYGRDERFGVWGATIPAERSPRAQRLPPAPCGTWQGYYKHLRAKDGQCDRCLAAYRLYAYTRKHSEAS
jgi:WhiB family transcriptional regulator, redox-sensing transcriptional regulator